MPTTEHTINDALAEVLRGTRHVWRSGKVVSSENTGMLKGSNAQPDILVLEKHLSPVDIETEVFPAVTVEAEAVARLGAQIRNTWRTILSSIAVRVPPALRTVQGLPLHDMLETTDELEMAIFTGSSPP
jgi:hypothetical protein